jgi:hypothetical protein
MLRAVATSGRLRSVRQNWFDPGHRNAGHCFVDV